MSSQAWSGSSSRGSETEGMAYASWTVLPTFANIWNPKSELSLPTVPPYCSAHCGVSPICAMNGGTAMGHSFHVQATAGR